MFIFLKQPGIAEEGAGNGSDVPPFTEWLPELSWLCCSEQDPKPLQQWMRETLVLGWSYSTEDKVLALHIADLQLIPGTLDGSLNTEPGVKPLHRWMWPRNESTKGNK